MTLAKMPSLIKDNTHRVIYACSINIIQCVKVLGSLLRTALVAITIVYNREVKSLSSAEIHHSGKGKQNYGLVKVKHNRCMALLV